MEVALGAYGLEGRLSIDSDMLRIVRKGFLEEIAYADILEVKAHGLLNKVTIQTKDRERTLSLWSLWPNKRKKIALEIEKRRAAAADVHTT